MNINNHSAYFKRSTAQNKTPNTQKSDTDASNASSQSGAASTPPASPSSLPPQSPVSQVVLQNTYHLIPGLHLGLIKSHPHGLGLGRANNRPALNVPTVQPGSTVPSSSSGVPTNPTTPTNTTYPSPSPETPTNQTTPVTTTYPANSSPATPATTTGSTDPNVTSTPLTSPTYTGNTPDTTSTAAKVMGSLNISGNPTVQVSTPGVSNPAITLEQSVGVPINILKDSDNQFSMDITLHEVNTNHTKGIQKADFTVNNHQIQFANDGSLMIDGVNKGNITDSGFIAPIDLGNGTSIKTALMDDGGGNQIERFVLDTPDYEITAARRTASNSKPYFDINIAERITSAADNATGDVISDAQKVSIAQLLQQEA